jgi:hypothetical protein
MRAIRYSISLLGIECVRAVLVLFLVEVEEVAAGWFLLCSYL